MYNFYRLNIPKIWQLEKSSISIAESGLSQYLQGFYNFENQIPAIIGDLYYIYAQGKIAFVIFHLQILVKPKLLWAPILWVVPLLFCLPPCYIL